MPRAFRLEATYVVRMRHVKPEYREGVYVLNISLSALSLLCTPELIVSDLQGVLQSYNSSAFPYLGSSIGTSRGPRPSRCVSPRGSVNERRADRNES